jgi:hypothetical protein
MIVRTGIAFGSTSRIKFVKLSLNPMLAAIDPDWLGKAHVRIVLPTP